MTALHLTARIPLDRQTSYVVSLIFERWCGWPLKIHLTGVTSSEPARLCIGSFVFNPVATTARERAQATRRLLATYFAVNNAMAMRGQKGSRLIEIVGEDAAMLDRDCLSAIFHVVSGEDEILSAERDRHNRFPAAASILQKHRLLDLPIVDLLAEYLQDRVRAQTPGLPVSQPAPSVVVSHDVDAPFQLALKKIWKLPRIIAGDILHRHRYAALWRIPFEWSRIRRGNLNLDAFNCFDRILKGHEKSGRRADFYFIAGRTGGRIDGDYTLQDPPIRALMAEVIKRGHRIGLHPSYHASVRRDALAVERNSLQSALMEHGQHEALHAVRTHYLRFDPLLTPELLEKEGFSEDSSLAFADYAGFRRGTCRQFPLWSHETHRQLGIVESPLIAMDASLLTTRYEGLSHPDAANRIDALRVETRRHGGTFSLLWHNNYLTTERDFALYEYAIR